jgi:hypothetical protein
MSRHSYISNNNNILNKFNSFLITPINKLIRLKLNKYTFNSLLIKATWFQTTKEEPILLVLI